MTFISQTGDICHWRHIRDMIEYRCGRVEVQRLLPGARGKVPSDEQNQKRATAPHKQAGTRQCHRGRYEDNILRKMRMTKWLNHSPALDKVKDLCYNLFRNKHLKNSSTFCALKWVGWRRGSIRNDTTNRAWNEGRRIKAPKAGMPRRSTSQPPPSGEGRQE